MQKFSIVVTEIVIARYLPVIVEAADPDTAKAMVEAQRADGELGDPCSEEVKSVSFECAPFVATDPDEAGPELYLTPAGERAVATCPWE